MHLNQFYKPEIESISTPNKNIQSTYMKSEQSFIVKDSQRFPAYRTDEEFFTVLLTPNDLIIGRDLSDCKILTTNAAKYSNLSRINEEFIYNMGRKNYESACVTENGVDSTTKSTAHPYLVNEAEISDSHVLQEQELSIRSLDVNQNTSTKEVNDRNKEPLVSGNSQITDMTNNENLESQNLDKKNVNSIATRKTDLPEIESFRIDEDCEFFSSIFSYGNFNVQKFHSIEILKSKLQQILSPIYKIPKKSFVTLVFPDEFARSEITACVDYFIKFCGCKGICLLPYSLATALGFCLNFCTVISQYKNFRTYSFIEDFCFVLSKTSFTEFELNENIFVPKTSSKNNILQYTSKDISEQQLQKNTYKNEQKPETNAQIPISGKDIRVIGQKLLDNLENDENNTIMDQDSEIYSEKTAQNKSHKDLRNFFESYDDVDFVEEFHKPGFKMGFCKCICSICNKSFDKESIIPHLKESHNMKQDEESKLSKLYKEKNEVKYRLKKNTVEEELLSCLKNYFPSDRIKKMITNIIIDQNLIIEDPTKIIEGIGGKIHIASPLDAFKGALSFSQLETAKDCWLTDPEWKAFRLRILKEKTLFYI